MKLYWDEKVILKGGDILGCRHALEDSEMGIVDELLGKEKFGRGTGLEVKTRNLPHTDSSWNNSNEDTDLVSRSSIILVVLSVFSGEIQGGKYNLS